MYFFKNLLLYSRELFQQTKYIVMVTKEGSIKIVNFMTPKAGVLVVGRGHLSHIVKMHYFSKNRLLYSLAQIRHTRCIVMIAKEGSSRIVNFMIRMAGVFVLGRGRISHILKMHFFFKIFFFTLWHDLDKSQDSNDGHGRLY